jgi:SAM-dependent methyltransferase
MRGLHNNACVIPVPVEKQPSRQRASSNAEDGTPHLLFVGRLAKEKNLETWFHVAKRVAEARKEVVIDVVGDGDLRATLEALADRLGLSQNVRFHGWVKHEDVHRFYGAATVLLLTSWHEGFGRVLVEAYYNGVCCVASRTRGAEDVIQDGLTGFLHAPDDVEGMARSVLRLIGDVALRNRMTRNGHEVVAARFSSQNLAKQWIELLINSTRRHLPQILPPRTRTWSRYLGLRRSRFSLLRSLQYEAIQGLSLSGLTLDVGGGARNSYWHLLRVNGSILSTNISWNVSPSVLCDLNRGLPFADATFDNVLSLNTFEHVYQDDTAITESLRVLRPGGQFHFIVPLIYQIHGSPSDFHRHTPDWWVRVLEKSGIGSTRFWMDSLVWDRVSTAMSFFGTGPLPRLVRSLLLMRGSFRDVFWELQRRPFDREAEGDLKVPVGLYVFGVKD